MNEQLSIQYGQHTLTIHILRCARKTMAIKVQPDATICAMVPLAASERAICERLQKRAGWIVKQLRFFSQFKPRTPPPEYVAGETHLFLGKPYRLKIAEAAAFGKAGVAISGEYLHITIPQGQPLAAPVLQAWYRQQAQAVFSELLEQCWQQFYQYTASAKPVLCVRHMQKRWASMSASGRLTISPSLVRAPLRCIEYVITHELCHIAHPAHNAAFFRLLSVKMPDWQERQLLLEKRLA